MLGLFLSLLPTFLVKIIGAIIPAATDAARALVDDRIQESKERIAKAEAAAEIRKATAGHWEQRLLAFVVGAVATGHWLLIGIGTNVAAPAVKVGAPIDWLAWTLEIPPFPAPYDDLEIAVLGFFYGYAAVTSVGQKIAGAIALRNRR